MDWVYKSMRSLISSSVYLNKAISHPKDPVFLLFADSAFLFHELNEFIQLHVAFVGIDAHGLHERSVSGCIHLNFRMQHAVLALQFYFNTVLFVITDTFEDRRLHRSQLLLVQIHAYIHSDAHCHRLDDIVIRLQRKDNFLAAFLKRTGFGLLFRCLIRNAAAAPINCFFIPLSSYSYSYYNRKVK